jgi:HK97 gp10 family phage protein
MARAAVDVTVTGLRDLRTDLKAIGKDAAKDGQTMLAGAADVIAQGAKPLVHSRTRRLADNIKGTTSGARGVVKVSGVKVPYGNLNHWGGTTGPGKHGPGTGPSKVRGNPFIEKAAEGRQVAVAEAVAEGLEEITRRYGFDL